MRRIFTLCSLAIVVFFASCNDTKNAKLLPYNQGINIIPMPNSLIQNDGYFTLDKNTSFYTTSAEAKTIAEFFASKLRLSTALPLLFTEEAKSNTIQLNIDTSLDINEEGYTLNITNKQVLVEAKTPQGLFYGMQSLMQLLPAEAENRSTAKNIDWVIPAVEIKDEPRLGYRGVMFDVCRHFIPAESIKKQLDVLALFKINRLHWHLTDDQGWRIEIKKYPKLTEIGSKRMEDDGTEHHGFYTQEEIKDIVAYAAERFITVIPEIEVPGHERAAIAAYPELSCKGDSITPRNFWAVEEIVLCAGKEETFEFFDHVIAEVAELFPSEYIHIGGDECPKTSWKACPLCQARIRTEGLRGDETHTSEERLQSYFVQRIEKTVSKYGKKIIGWDEILEGGLAPSATVMSWRGEKGGIEAAFMNHDVIMTPGNTLYLDMYEGDPKIEPVAMGGRISLEKVYNYNPIPDTLQVMGKSEYIKGVQGNVWTEFIYDSEQMEYRTYPRLLAVAEIGWTQPQKKDYTDFERRIENALVRLDAHHINYNIPQPEQPNGSCNFVAFTDSVALAFKTSRPVKMIYTLDGTDPNSRSKTYDSPVTFTESGVLKIRSVLLSGKMGKTRTITVEKQTLSPAVEVESTKAGLQLEVTYGTYRESAKLSEATDWKKSVIKELWQINQVEKADRSLHGVKPYAAIANGFIHIPEDGVYFVSSVYEEVWIDGRLLIDNKGEPKHFARHDNSVALAKGLHPLKVVFLGNITGGWPSYWSNGNIMLRNSDAEEFTPVTAEMLTH